MINTRLFPTRSGKRLETGGKKEFTEFVRRQFSQLVKKNLNIPVTLYQL
ncbi:hypothetical protein M1523_02615 [Patescibacteria group bacterium]|nr:hypothetical protein [Patescibacteria group bacterium]MCL5091386.1 hypothetical protein [Patescibacteria group bacterium]